MSVTRIFINVNYSMDTGNVSILDTDDLDALCRAIDWAEYQSMLEQSLANEKIWELGYMDGYNPHTDNIAGIEEELGLLSAGEYEAVVRMHDAEFFQDFV